MMMIMIMNVFSDMNSEYYKNKVTRQVYSK